MATFRETLLAPERRREMALEQAVLKERFGSRVNTDPSIAKYRFGRARQELMENQLIQYVTIDSEEARTQYAWLFNALAEAFGLQGNFKAASQTAQSEALKYDFQQKANAVHSLGHKLCTCPATRDERQLDNAKIKTVSAIDDVEEVFDGTRKIILYRCSFCQIISARLK